MKIKSLLAILIAVCVTSMFPVNHISSSASQIELPMPKELYITTYNNIQLKVDKHTLNPCEEITVKYSGLPKDVPATINIGEFSKSLWYKTEGEMKVIVPSNKGIYNARIFINGNPNSVIYDKELISVSKTFVDKTVEDPLNVIPRLYFADFWNFTLARAGYHIRGYYDHNNGYIEGTVEGIDSGYKITGTFKEICEKTGKEYTGDIILYISSDAEIVQGSWKLWGYSIWEPLSGGWPNGDVYGLRNIRINSGMDKVSLLWDESFQEGIAGYNVYRKSASGTWDSKPLNNKPLSEIQYIDTKVQHGQKYTYLVKGVFENGLEKNISAETSIYCGKVISINFKNYSLWTQTLVPQMNLTNYYPFTQIEHNYVIVPLRFYSELVGCTVNWDSLNKEAVVTKDQTTIKIKPNNLIMDVNGRSVKLPYFPSYLGDSLCVPLRAVFSQLGCSIKWDAKTQTADIVF
ncbi:MAG TPA: copper amine oxidase N-terminal domain-containing protein [Pseudobacteroides sp.]|uniref:copper amine oxidase N-terminal domain-containing protein n=1 Tax=Pseudobacteroides sp. TaxID=1968840 RepID=UPI002F94F920